METIAVHPAIDAPVLTRLSGIRDYAAERCARWGVPQLEWIPVTGQARKEHWAGTSPGTMQVPGRNHPELGAWLWRKYVPKRVVAADPMAGAGGLWLLVRQPKPRVLYTCDCAPTLREVLRKNLSDIEIAAEVEIADARYWEPRDPVGPVMCVMTSFEFRNAHSAGNSEMQKKIMEKQHTYACQGFSKEEASLTRRPSQYWQEGGAPMIYRRMKQWMGTGAVLLVVIRDFIRKGQEVDEPLRHINAARDAGFSSIGMHPREIFPGPYVQMQRAINPDAPWIPVEWTMRAYAR